MKRLEFETSKDRFIVTDVPDILNGDVYYGGNKNKGIKLSEITELEASKIVELKGDRFQDYNHVSCCDRWCNTAIESLHSLLKSKGIHLYENPAPLLHHTRLEVEEKTFYNPYIFKL